MAEFFMDFNLIPEIRQLHFDQIKDLKHVVDYTYAYNFSTLHDNPYYKELPPNL